MQTKKQASPFSNMSDEQLIFYGFDDLSSKIERDAPLDKSVFKSSNMFLVIMNHFVKNVTHISC